MSRAQDALRVAERIATMRAELAALEATFFDMFGESAPSTTTPASTLAPKRVGKPAAAAATSGTIAERLQALFRGEPTKSFDNPAVFAALPDLDEKSVRGTLGRLSRDKNGIRRVSRGRYRYTGPQIVQPAREEPEKAAE